MQLALLNDGPTRRRLPPPVIKWAGSKRAQSLAIATLAPQFKRYFEPFVGGGALLYQMAPADGVAADICQSLIDLWSLVQKAPDDLANGYAARWNELQARGHTYYYVVRDDFNASRDPVDFLFLSRTCVNGLIRFNGKGDFNNSFHLTRPGIHPDRLRRIILDWSGRIQDTTFLCQDYRESFAMAGRGDFVYLDPPYFNTRGRYYGGIHGDEFFREVEELVGRGAFVALSYDGQAGGQEYAAPVPDGLFQVRLSLPNGHSAFRKTQAGYLADVTEALYLSYRPS